MQVLFVLLEDSVFDFKIIDIFDVALDFSRLELIKFSDLVPVFKQG